MQFKHNQRVKCNIDGTEITDAKISINEGGTPYICQNLEDGCDADDKLGYKYSWVLHRDFTYPSVTNLRPAEKSFDYPEVGDEYKDEDDDSRFVLGVTGRVIFLSEYNDKDSYGGGYTKEQLIKKSYTIVQDEPVEEVKEMTVADVEKLVGKKVKIIK